MYRRKEVMHHPSNTRARFLVPACAATLLAGALLLASCDSSTEPPYQADLDALREATQSFADVNAAASAGYTTELTACMADPQQGGMGFHTGNASLIDATVELTKPEVAIYEPTAGGGRTLVGLEFLVPFDAWTSQTPPALMGQSFKRNETFQVWALHVWLYRDNPRGVFADWNPTVSCANAPAIHAH
jgi:hypothetical protein